MCMRMPTGKSISWELHFISSVYIATPLFVIGLLTNIICIVLWKRLIKRARNRNISCGIYLVTIAAADTGTITSFFLSDTLLYMIPNITKHHGYNVFYAYIGYPSFMFFTFLSFWLIAGVDTCRLTMVIFPIKLRQAATRITNIVILLIIVNVFMVNIPNFFAFDAPHTNEGAPCLIKTSLFKKKSFFNYTFWFQCVFLTIFPWGVIIVVNIVMVLHKMMVPVYIPKWNRRGKEMGHVLLAVSVWFVIIIFWQCVAQCFFLQTKHKPMHHWEHINRSFAFAKLGLVINSSTKFFLFLAASTSFRKSFVHFITNKKSSYVSRFKPAKETNRIVQKRKNRRINAIIPLERLEEGASTTLSKRRLFLVQEISSIDITF